LFLISDGKSGIILLPYNSLDARNHMTDAALPEKTSIALAAAIAGRPRAAFKRQYVEAGLVEVDHTTGGRVVVLLPSLERVLSRSITVAEFKAAEHRLAPTRAYQADWRRRHRKSQIEGPGHDRP
jgi:hypothetical protein